MTIVEGIHTVLPPELEYSARSASLLPSSHGITLQLLRPQYSQLAEYGFGLRVQPVTPSRLHRTARARAMPTLTGLKKR